MNTSRRVHVGTPPGDFKGWTTTEVCFHGFANLSTTRDEYVESPEFSCLGTNWVLKLCPGGEEESEEGHVSAALANRSNSSRDANGKEVVHIKSDTDEFGAYESGNNAWFNLNFAKRSRLLDKLVDGALVIEVRMKSTAADKSITQFIPTNPLCKNVINKFMDEESADVVFEIDDSKSCQSEEHTSKKSKSTTALYAHRFILQDISTMLAELCKSDESGITTVSITDVSPEIFKHMIYYTYGGKLSEEKLKANAKDIINACDKYGVVHLKLEAEACYVKSNEISMENMMDNLLYADSKNLALLKEAVMDYILTNKGDIMDKVSFDNLPGSLMKDLLAAVARGEQSGDSNSTDYNTMRVGTLRKMLDEKGLDVDGSRESMIALLKEESA